MIKTILTMYIIHIAGMVLCVGKEFYVIQILELFYVEIIIFPVIFDGQTPMFAQNGLSTVGKSEKRILIPMKMDVPTHIIQILLIRYPQRYAVRS